MIYFAHHTVSLPRSHDDGPEEEQEEKEGEQGEQCWGSPLIFLSEPVTYLKLPLSSLFLHFRAEAFCRR